MAGSAASSLLQAQMLHPQVPAFAGSETAAPAGAGTGCCTGTPGDGDTSASRMTTRSGLGITVRSLPAAGKYPGGYQRLLFPRQPCLSLCAGGRKGGTGSTTGRSSNPILRPLYTLLLLPAASPGLSIFAQLQRGFSSSSSLSLTNCSPAFPRIQPYRIQPCSVCTEAEITAAPFQQGGDKPACCNYQIRQQPPKSSSRTWRSQPGLSKAARCSWHRLRSCPPLFLPPPAPSRNSSKGFPCTGQGEELLLC